MSQADFAKFVKNRLASLVSFANAGTDISSTNAQGALVELANRHFGKELAQTVNNGPGSTTSTAYQSFLTLVTPDVPLGLYIIMWSAEVLKSSANAAVQTRIQENGTNIISEVEYTAIASNNWQPVSGFHIEQHSGVLTYTMDWRKVSGPQNVDIRNAHFLFFRLN